MPGVNPPADGGYNYYQRTISDLEDEMRDQTNKTKKAYEERAATLEKNYKKDLDEHDQDRDRTLNNFKEKANDTIANDRAYSKAEVNRVKAETYDRFGRSHGMEADVLKGQLDDLKKASDVRIQQDHAELSDTEKAYQAKLASVEQQAADSKEDAVRAQRDSTAGDFARSTENQNRVYAQSQKEAEDKYNELNRIRMDDLNRVRRQYDAALSEAHRDFDHLSESQRHADAKRASQQEENYFKKTDETARHLDESHSEESKLLRDQIKDLITAESFYKKDSAKAREGAIRDYEDDWRSKLALTDESYRREIDGLHQKARETDITFAHKNSENLKEKDAYFAQVFNRQNLDNLKSQQDLKGAFQRDHDQLELQMKRDREQSRATHEARLEDEVKTRNLALENQALNYQDTMNRQRASTNQEISSLQKHLQEANTSEKSGVLSPAAEAAARKAVVNEYGKSVDADIHRNRRTIDQMQGEYAERLTQVTEEQRNKETVLQRQIAAERHQDQKDFLSHTSDMEMQKNTTLRNKDEDNSREASTLTRSYSQLLERQRKEQDAVLQATKDDASAKLAATRQEAEFNSKMAMRSFAVRENELIRDYSKKLAEQKTEYETQMNNLKLETQQQLHEGERKNRNALEEQARSYEQRLAQVEVQYKERERYMTQSHQDELEKARRSNALTSSRKA